MFSGRRQLKRRQQRMTPTRRYEKGTSFLASAARNVTKRAYGNWVCVKISIQVLYSVGAKVRIRKKAWKLPPPSLSFLRCVF